MTALSRGALTAASAGLLVGVFLALSGCGGDEEPAPIATLLPAVETATTISGPESRVTSEPARAQPERTEDLPAPQWTPADGSSPTGWGENFLVDVRSGEVWSLTSQPRMTSQDPMTWLLAWSPFGEALVAVVDVERSGASALYAGVPTTSFRHLITVNAHIHGASWSPDGALVAIGGAMDGPSEVLLVVDSTTGDIVAELSELDAAVGAWSADGRFLTVSVRGPEGPEIVIWDRRDGSTERVVGHSASWSRGGHGLVYVPGPFLRSEAPWPQDIRVRDLGAGTDTAVATVTALAVGGLIWSPDERFVAAHLSSGSGSEARIIDITGRVRDVVVHGVSLGGWLDVDTLLFTGNVCSTFDIFTPRADGSGLTNYTNSPSHDLYPRQSPDGRMIAFTGMGGEGGAIRLLSFPDGAIQDLASGPAFTLFSLSVSPDAVWSPDGRYVAFGIEGGHGLCEGSEPQTTWVELSP